MASGWHRRNPDSPAARARKAQYRAPEYRKAKAAARVVVDAGLASCWRCGHWLAPGGPWHLGHDDHDRSIIRGPECVTCSSKTAASRGALIANARRKMRRLGVTALRM